MRAAGPKANAAYLPFEITRGLSGWSAVENG